MKKYIIFVVSIFVLFSVKPTSAWLEFYFEDGSVYRSEVVSSPHYRGSSLLIRTNSRVDPLPRAYELVETIDVQTLEVIIHTHYEEEYREEQIPQFAEVLYEIYNNIDDNLLKRYIDLAITEETEEIIQDRMRNDILLTPYEKELIDCDISLSERQIAIIDALSKYIDTDNFEIMDNDIVLDDLDCIFSFTEIIPDSIWDDKMPEDIVIHWQISEKIRDIYQLHTDIYNQMLENWMIHPSLHSRLVNSYLDTISHLEYLNNTLLSENYCSTEFTWKVLKNYNKAIIYFQKQFLEGQIDQTQFLQKITKINMFIRVLYKNTKKCLENNMNQNDFTRVLSMLEDYYVKNFTIIDDGNINHARLTDSKYSLHYILLILSVFLCICILYFTRKFKAWK